jgi:hypothetical protein
VLGRRNRRTAGARPLLRWAVRDGRTFRSCVTRLTNQRFTTSSDLGRLKVFGWIGEMAEEFPNRDFQRNTQLVPTL